MAKDIPRRQATCYAYINDDAWYRDYDFAIKDVARFSWYLMFEGVIPDSQNKIWEDQLKMKPDGYEIPKVVEVVPLHFLIYRKNNGQRIDEDVWGRTIDVDSDGSHVRAGRFDGDGFYVYSYYDSHRHSYLGVFFLRKIEP